MQPYDYTIKGENPLDAYFSGYQGGMKMQGDQIALEQKRLANEKAQQEALRQQEVAQATKTLMQKISDKTATPEDYATARILMPKDQAEQVAKIAESMESSRLQNSLQFGAQMMAALGTKPEIAIEILTEKVKAHRDRGETDQARVYETAIKIAEISPDKAQRYLGELIGAIPGGDKFIKGVTDFQANQRQKELQPEALTKAKADAKKATSEAETWAIKSKYAEEMAGLEKEKATVDIAKLANDIDVAKSNKQVALARLNLERELQPLRKQELEAKVKELQDKRLSTVREKIAEVTDARSGMDMLSNNIYKALATKDDVMRSALGPVDSRLPTLQTDVADFEELIATIKSGVFLSSAQKMKGLGALSEKEGEQLMNAMGSLSLRQSRDQLTKTLQEIDRLTQKGRKALVDKYGVQDTERDVPDAPQPTKETISELLKKYAK